MSRNETGAGTPLEIEVRAGVIEDVPQLVAIERHENLKWRLLPARLRTEIESRDRMLMVAEVDGRVAGYLSGGYVEGDDSWWLRRLIVAHDLRGGGVGTALCTTALAQVDEQGAECELWVVAANGGAIALYERLGFERVGADGEYLRGMVRMRRRPRRS